MNIELTEVKRQSDENLVSILNKLRLGQCGDIETQILAGIQIYIWFYRILKEQCPQGPQKLSSLKSFQI